MKREYIRLIGLGAAVIFGIVGLSGCGQGGSGTGAGIQPEVQTAKLQTSGAQETGAQDIEAQSGKSQNTESQDDEVQAAESMPGSSGEDKSEQKNEKVKVKTQPVIAQTTFPLPDGPEESEIFIAPVEGIADDFIRGMDASSVIAEEESGVRYYNFDGEEQDVFMTLAQAGVNYIRLRVWNDPYDAGGHGYGGGNCDVPKAIELGRRATQYGMKVCIDFHYSDSWADPKRQHAPKAWEGMSVDEKCSALYEFTAESLTDILDAGVDVGMVQIGNEINNGMSGESQFSAVAKLLNSGSRAVRETAAAYGKDIQVAVHYTDINQLDKLDAIAANLKNNNVDYDIFAMSYYPYWHGTAEDMQEAARRIQEKYGKKTLIAETAYPYTNDEGDGTGNSVSSDDLVPGYPAKVQSQATMIRDICAAASDAGALGVFYWEGVWIPVGPATADNSLIWEKYGSGWASSYAADYDPDDAGLYYGGCSWDNQAMFDWTGHPLASLNVFKYLKYGATAPLAFVDIPDVNVFGSVGSGLQMPDKVDVIYNDPSANTQMPVTWDSDALAAIDMTRGGEYMITGVLEDGTKLPAHVEILMLNLVENPGFEGTDTSMWKVTYAGNKNPTDFQVKADDAYSGNVAFHFWSESDMDFSIEQEVTNLEPGIYQLTVCSQGGDMSADAEMELYAVTDGGEMTQPFMVTGYADWKTPKITGIRLNGDVMTIGVRVKCGAKGWGTVDDFTLNRVGDLDGFAE